MIRIVEAVVDEKGRVRLLEKVALPEARRALVTILEEDPKMVAGEAALLSEQSLAGDWNRSEEDEAWSYLQSEK
ncbi:MAG: hypothetical protein ACLQOO_36710 [Terriglobia bacterium]